MENGTELFFQQRIRNSSLFRKGFAHGFLVLSENAEFTYKCSDFYHPNDEGGLIWNDPGH